MAAYGALPGAAMGSSLEVWQWDFKADSTNQVVNLVPYCPITWVERLSSCFDLWEQRLGLAMTLYAERC